MHHKSIDAAKNSGQELDKIIFDYVVDLSSAIEKSNIDIYKYMYM
jgi:hypothetical protein